MDDVLKYTLFATCVFACGGMIVYLKWREEWKNSQQKAAEEYWKFMYYMDKLHIDRVTAREALISIESLEKLCDINRKLKKRLGRPRVLN